MTKRLTFVYALTVIGLLTFTAHGTEKDIEKVLRENAKSLKDQRVKEHPRPIEKDRQKVKPSKATRAVEEAANESLRETRRVTRIATSKAIYDEDNRKDYNESNKEGQQAADATVILVKAQKLKPSPDGSFDLPSENIIKGGRGLCTEAQCKELGLSEKEYERFYDQANPGFCSGFRIGQNRIATAGHCIETQLDCAETRFVFGFYKTTQKPHPEKGISSDRVYSCKSIVAGKHVEGGPDWRVVEVDREMTFGSDVVLRTATTQPQLKENDWLVVVGYPMGLPVKIADGAQVWEIGDSFFKANLDTYGGNSGSAVFNREQLDKGKLLVEGILVRGEIDWEKQPPETKCYLSKRCPERGCRGEDVTLASEIVFDH